MDQGFERGQHTPYSTFCPLQYAWIAHIADAQLVIVQFVNAKFVRVHFVIVPFVNAQIEQLGVHNL